ncbi:imm11 family protein, partial [Corallococcus carmarthensis]|uniref:imm11 family protein n=1 Tax=Corallococcus carmarthensis TaxID=2316728 RepID=UPI00148BBB68
MASRYYRLAEDLDIPDRWQLGAPVDQRGQTVNPWQFTKGNSVQLDAVLRMPVSVGGKPLDFTLAELDIPVIDPKVAAILSERAPGDVQLIPVQIDSQPGAHRILVATRLVRCIDDRASEEVRYWTPEDGRPEKVGKYRAVSGMRIDPTKVGDAKVFRTWGWTLALIVSEDIKDALERAGVTGLKFTEVTGPSAISPEERERNRRLIELREQTDAARQAFWRTLGTLDEEVIIPIVVGGNWPARRQVWRVIHRPEGRTLLVTDGLSDFFVDRAEPSVGFGLELALETDEPIKDAEKSWPLMLLAQMGNEIAEHESVREKVKAGFLSMEVAGQGLPEPLLTKEG